MVSSINAKLLMGFAAIALIAIAPAAAGSYLDPASLRSGLAMATGALIACGLAAIFLSRSIAKPLAAVAQQLQTLTAEAVTIDAIATAQRSLDTNIDYLRGMLYEHGDPVRDGDKLYFGNFLVNGNNDVVDKVQSTHGGMATVFLGDLRLATNIKDASGKRMTGTRLAAGPAYETIFTQGRSYRGEVEIAGQRYIAIYEPVFCGQDTIGIIFVAVTKSAAIDKTAGGSLRRKGDDISRMAAGLETLRGVTVGKEGVMRESLDQRYVLADARRKTEAQGRVAARAQQNVVSALSTALERLAGSDLTHHIDVAFPLEYQKLKDDFAAAIQALSATMRAIMGEAKSMRGHSDEIATAVDELSRRTEQQAASLEETAASLDVITSTVKRTAEGVQDARRVVTQTKTDAEHSSQIVTQAVEAMSAIENSSAKISQIVSVIDDIALQTNLLALNAGVEAARAGDAGRGFAVVASEVRALAQRSAEAAKEIKELILASTRQVTEGVALVGETGRSLERIVQQVADVDGIVATISQTAQEQAVSLQEVNTAITQMDRATQQNAAMVEESTAASHHLAQEAGKLQDLVGQFQTGANPALERTPALSGRPATPSTTRPAPIKPAPVRPARIATAPARGPAARKVQAAPERDWEEF